MATSFQKKPSASDMAAVNDALAAAENTVAEMQGALAEVPAAGLIMDEATSVSTTDASSGPVTTAYLRLKPELYAPLHASGRRATVSGLLVGAVPDLGNITYRFEVLVKAVEFNSFSHVPDHLEIFGTPSLEVLETLGGFDAFTVKHLAEDGIQGLSVNEAMALDDGSAQHFLGFKLIPYSGAGNPGKTVTWTVENVVCHTDPALPA